MAHKVGNFFGELTFLFSEILIMCKSGQHNLENGFQL